MIRALGVKKSFEKQHVLKGVSLDVRDNETMVILGPSGQGKTVFIKTLVRLMEPDEGVIEYDGVDILKLKDRQLQEFRKSIAFVFQNSALFDFLNVRENMALYLRMHRDFGDEEIEERIVNALHVVGLQEEVLDKFPEELSGGNSRATARSLNPCPYRAMCSPLCPRGYRAREATPILRQGALKVRTQDFRALAKASAIVPPVAGG